MTLCVFCEQAGAHNQHAVSNAGVVPDLFTMRSLQQDDCSTPCLLSKAAEPRLSCTTVRMVWQHNNPSYLRSRRRPGVANRNILQFLTDLSRLYGACLLLGLGHLAPVCDARQRSVRVHCNESTHPVRRFVLHAAVAEWTSRAAALFMCSQSTLAATMRSAKIVRCGNWTIPVSVSPGNCRPSPRPLPERRTNKGSKAVESDGLPELQSRDVVHINCVEKPKSRPPSAETRHGSGRKLAPRAVSAKGIC